MKVVENLSREDLLSIAESGEMVYASLEQQFLSQYAYYTFFNKPFPSFVDLIDDERALLEINQAVFAEAISLDLIVARRSELKHLENVAKEKAIKLNPLFAALGIEEVECEKNPLSALAEMKLKGSQCLERTTNKITFETELRDDLADRFPEVKEEAYSLYGNVPTLVFGSSLKSDNPHDIDIKIVVPDFSEDTYRKIIGTNNSEIKLPLNFIIVPATYLNAWVLSDAHPAFRSTHSVLVNGSLSVPVISDERLESLRRQSTVNRYIEARKTLTPEKLSQCEDVLARMNNRLKIPKFIHADLSQYSSIEKPPIIRFNSLPDKETFTEAMVNTNLQLNRMLSAFYQK